LKVTASLALALFNAWMVLKIRFRTLKFYLKNYILCGRKERKKKAFAKTGNGSGYAEKETERQPSLPSRKFRLSFMKTVGQPHSFGSLDGLQKNRVSSSFYKIFLRLLCCQEKNVFIS